MGPPDSTPTAAEFGRLRAALARRGLTPQQQSAAAGDAPGGRTRRQVARAVAAWLRARPRGPSDAERFALM